MVLTVILVNVSFFGDYFNVRDSKLIFLSLSPYPTAHET